MNDEPLTPSGEAGRAGRRGRDGSVVLREADFPLGPPLGAEVCGIDEAGRGPLAGPVSAGAVVLPSDFPLVVLDDSKALSAKRREEAYALIVDGALAWSVAWAYPCEIDELNILGASLLAMRRAYLGMAAMLARRDLSPPSKVYVDGNRLPDLGPRRAGLLAAVIKGDAIVPAIMAASILAKVARDRAMERFDWLYPEYGYARHKGYPTAAHRAVCRALGPSPIQRMSFNYGKLA